MFAYSVARNAGFDLAQLYIRLWNYKKSMHFTGYVLRLLLSVSVFFEACGIKCHSMAVEWQAFLVRISDLFRSEVRDIGPAALPHASLTLSHWSEHLSDIQLHFWFMRNILYIQL